MSADEKKQREQADFQRARPFVPEWHGGDVTEGESPDILITRESSRIGVELTSIVVAPLRAELAAKNNALRMARTQFEDETGVRGLRVNAGFWPGIRMSKAEQRPAALDLHRIVKDEFPLGTTGVLCKRLGELDDDFESEYFQTLHLRYHPHIESSHWLLAEAQPVSLLTAAEIQTEIEKKEAKIERYLQRASTCWLLISTNGFEAPPAKVLDYGILGRRYHSSFDGVVLFDDLMERAYRLSVHARPTDAA